MADGAFRAFVALPMPAEVQAYLQAVQLRLNGRVPGAVRWVGADGMHLTLKFLGDISPTQVPAIEALLREQAAAHPPFTLALSNVGCFPNAQRPRVLWAGCAGEVRRLQDLYAPVEAGLVAQGFAPEGRPYAPHITLGRVREYVSPEGLQELGDILRTAPALSAAPPAHIDRLVLYRSTLTPQGSVYQHLVVAPLGQPAG